VSCAARLDLVGWATSNGVALWPMSCLVGTGGHTPTIPPKEKLSKEIVTMKHHLSLGWLLVHSLVDMVHSWWLFGFRKGILKDIW
jgi:hypothetical protein